MKKNTTKKINVNLLNSLLMACGVPQKRRVTLVRTAKTNNKK